MWYSNRKAATRPCRRRGVIKMKKYILLAFALVLWTTPCFSESVDTVWVRIYDGPTNGHDCAYAVGVDDFGNVYVTGSSDGDGTSRDFVTIRYYPNGETAWVRRYDGPSSGDDNPTGRIAVDGFGYVYVAGESWGDSVTGFEFATIKYDPGGDTVWVRRYGRPGDGYDRVNEISVDDFGNVYVTGFSDSAGMSKDFTTIKYNVDGDTAWVRFYDGQNGEDDVALDVAVDDVGNAYVTGYSYASGTDVDFATIRYNTDGDTGWVRRYDGPVSGEDRAMDIAVDASGNVCVTGYSDGDGTADDFATIKYYPDGETAWVRRYDGPAHGADVPLAIAVDDSGNVYVTGYSDGGGTSNDFVTIKYYPYGDTAWVRRYDGPTHGEDVVSDIAVDDSGNVYVAGYGAGPGGDVDYITIKYRHDGDTSWVRRYDGPNNDDDQTQDITVDASGNAYVTGFCDGTAGTSSDSADFATIWYGDVSPPHVASTSPTQNQLNVDISANISVTFDMDMDQTTINDSTFVVNARSTGLHLGNISYDGPSRTATFDPLGDFDEGELVTVALTRGIESFQGTPLDSAHVWCFTLSVSDGPGYFFHDSVYSVGRDPRSVFCADFDGDGHLDLATANDTSTNVSVLLNSGNGTFGPDSVYPVGTAPVSIFSADLDGDGDMDLVTADRDADSVTVLLNNGSAVFDSTYTYPAGHQPESLLSADLDGDGDLDLAVANVHGPDVWILLNNGDATFTYDSAYPVGQLPSYISAGDLDNDGDLDLATVNYASGSYDVSVLLNNGDGTFSPHSTYPAGTAPFRLFSADFDDDGDLDLAVPNYSRDSVSILLNDSTGVFSIDSQYAVGSVPYSVFCGDVDGDGDQDLSVANKSSANVSILLNKGDATFDSASAYPVGHGPECVFFADLDGDGDLDLAVVNRLDDNVSVLFNCLPTGDCNEDGVVDVGDVVYLIAYLYRGGPAPDPIGVGDVNCDGIVDLGDVVYLISYLYRGGPPPACC